MQTVDRVLCRIRTGSSVGWLTCTLCRTRRRWSRGDSHIYVWLNAFPWTRMEEKRGTIVMRGGSTKRVFEKYTQSTPDSSTVYHPFVSPETRKRSRHGSCVRPLVTWFHERTFVITVIPAIAGSDGLEWNIPIVPGAYDTICAVTPRWSTSGPYDVGTFARWNKKRLCLLGGLWTIRYVMDRAFGNCEHATWCDRIGTASSCPHVKFLKRKKKKKIQNSLCPCIGRRACFNHSLRRMVAGTSCRLQIGIFAAQPWHYKRTSNSITNLHRFRSIRDERLKSPMHIRPRRRRLMRQTLPICTYSVPLVRCSNNRLSRCYYLRYQYLIIPFRLKIRHNVPTTATGYIVL